ncbi:MAG: Gfo/Idh/MocA family oxidoreductase [Microbacteriaceae bacterium]|nr:Gfo/Idh/MocA family oxidoreductase [Microbacteriaceae bacterium]
MKPLRIGVSGLGSIGRQHLRALEALTRDSPLELFACDPVAGSRHEAGREFGERVKIEESFDALIRAGLDGVVIAAPDHVHVEQTEAAIGFGAAVLVEKPLAATLEDAAKLLALDSNRIVVGYVLRHKRILKQVLSRLDEGAIGRVVSFQVLLGARGTIAVAANRFAQPQASRLYADYSHEWDYSNWLFGRITSVACVERTVPAVDHHESPNAVDALVRTDAEIVGAIHIDYTDSVGVRTLQIIGTDGSVRVEIVDGQSVWTTRAGVEVIDLEEDSFQTLCAQMSHFLSVCDGTDKPAVRIEDGLAALAVAHSLQKASHSSRWEAVTYPFGV